jgi:ketosteroid isomerase-like protein
VLSTARDEVLTLEGVIAVVCGGGDTAQAMSQENVEIAPVEVMRGWVDAWNQADLANPVSAFDVEAVVITDPSWMEPGPFEGRAAIRKWYEGLRESWEGRNTIAIAELFEVDANVVARLNWEVRGRSSGIDTTLDATFVNRIERGKIVRQQWYFDYDKALEAVGLSE